MGEVLSKSRKNGQRSDSWSDEYPYVLSLDQESIQNEHAISLLKVLHKNDFKGLLKQSWNSKVFGGCVLNAVGRLEILEYKLENMKHKAVYQDTVYR